MVERFDGCIAEVLRTHHFRSHDGPEATIKRYVWLYNHHLSKKAIRHRSPIQTLEGLAGPQAGDLQESCSQLSGA